MRTTLTATPRRSTVLVAKSVVLTGVVLVAGADAVFGCLLAAGLILPGNGFTTAQRQAMLSPADGPTLRAAAGSVLYLVLIALLALGTATAVRDPAAVGVVLGLGLLFVLPILTHLVTDPDWHRHLQQIAPMTAGLAIQSTIGADSLPIGPWAGLGVLAGWAVAALLGGGAGPEAAGRVSPRHPTGYATSRATGARRHRPAAAAARRPSASCFPHG
jgi:ABC-2 type transport system permease protein